MVFDSAVWCQEQLQLRRKVGFFLTATLLLMLGIGVGIGVGVGVFSDEETTAPVTTPTLAPVASQAPSISPGPTTAAPTDDLSALIINAAKPTTSRSTFDDDTSIQFKALQWLHGNENLQFYSDKKKITRWALAVFYYATNGDQWNIRTNWLSDLDECTWYTAGNTPACNDDKEFSNLELRSNGATGTIPPELGLMSDFLEVLNVRGVASGSQLAGSLPTELGFLTELQELTLESNAMTGSLPSEMIEMSRLETLNLASNDFNGSVKSRIVREWTSLRSINLSFNDFTGGFTAAFSASKDLQDINLEGNGFTGEIPPLSKLTNLRTLNVASNQLSGQLPREVSPLTQLREMTIRDNLMSGTIHTELGLLNNLEKLDLANNTLSFAIPTELGLLTNLRVELDVSDNNLIGGVPTQLGKLTSLRRLRVNGNNIAGTVPTELTNLAAIRVFRIDSTDMTGSMPTGLCSRINILGSVAYADCGEVDCPCCSHCCTFGNCNCRSSNAVTCAAT